MPFFPPSSKPLPILGEVVRQYRSEERFIGRSIFPVWGTRSRQGYLPVIPRDDVLRIYSTAVAPGGTYPRVSFGASGLQYFTEKHGLEIAVPAEVSQEHGDLFPVLQEAAISIELMLRRQVEIRLAAAIQNTTTFTANGRFTDNKANPWSTAGTNIVTQVDAAVEAVRGRTGISPNALIINNVQLQRIINNTDIKSRIQYVAAVTPGNILAALTAIFRLDYILVGDAVKDASARGQTASVSNVWSSTYATVARIAPGESTPISERQLARTILWTPNSPSDATVDGRYDEATESDILRVKHHVDELLLDPDLAQLLQVET